MAAPLTVFLDANVLYPAALRALFAGHRSPIFPSLPEAADNGYIPSMEIDPEQWLTCRWQKGNRYYVAALMQDLFGAWLLKRTWGSIDTHRGQTKTLSADNYDHALKFLHSLEKRRKARGYTRTE